MTTLIINYYTILEVYHSTERCYYYYNKYYNNFKILLSDWFHIYYIYLKTGKIRHPDVHKDNEQLSDTMIDTKNFLDYFEFYTNTDMIKYIL